MTDSHEREVINGALQGLGNRHHRIHICLKLFVRTADGIDHAVRVLTWREKMATRLIDDINPEEMPRRGKSSLNATAARLGAVGTALLLVVFLVLSVSRAAFVSTTDNASNSVSTGSLSLTDDDSGTAMFSSVTGLVPLNTVTRCIQIDYAGSINPVPVLLYASGAPTGTLGTYLDLTIEIGPTNADAFFSCASFAASSTLYTGTLAGFASTYDSYANGLTTWDPAGTDARTFRVTVTVQDNPLAAGLTAGWGLTWETRSS